MMKRFPIECDFNGIKRTFHVYVGEPDPKRHPLQFQNWWMTTMGHGTIPQEEMDKFERLHKIAIENNVSFEDLCVYAIENAVKESPS